MESLRPGISHPVDHVGRLVNWFEHVEPAEGVETVLKTTDGRPAYLSHDRFSYFAGWPDEDLLQHILSRELDAAGINTVETGDDLRLRDKGGLRTIVNYGPKPRDASHLVSSRDKILVGETMLDVAGVLIVERAK